MIDLRQYDRFVLPLNHAKITLVQPVHKLMFLQSDLFGNDSVIENPDSIVRRYLESTQGIPGIPSVTSLSGGRTSAWMSINYPTDFYVFALVRTNDPGHVPDDPGLLKAIQEKCPDFVGSLELPDTLRCVLELEQKIGKEIEWVWGDRTFEEVVTLQKYGYLPNFFTRYCTELLKYIPIFEWTLKKFNGDLVEMNLGFRADEPNRVYRMVGGKQIKGGWNFTDIGKCERHPTKKGKSIEWRLRQAPLYMNGIKKHHIHSDPWITSKPFPEISNCTHCFFHTVAEHRKQHEQNPQCASFWTGLENSTGNTFLKGVKLQEILDGSKTPLFEDEQPCACTD